MLPRAVRARSFRLTILGARFPGGTTARQRAARAVGIGSLSVPGLPAVDVPTDGTLRTTCGSIAIRAGGRRVALQPRGTVADLLAGRPLPARGCAGDAALDEGLQFVSSLPGAFSVDLLRLRSAAPRPAQGVTGGGAVTDSGRLTDTEVSDVRVALDGRSRLVLGQSYSKGWEATCDGRALGAPRPINAYANGWPAPADCRRVSFSFGPQASVRSGQVVSAVVCLLLLAFVLAGRALHRRRAEPQAPGAPAGLPADRTHGMALPRAAGIALAATVPLSLLFALRTGFLIFPTLAFILWRGVGPRPLTAVAAGLLAVLPLVYAASRPENRGGYNFEYSIDVIWGHWVAVAAMVLLMAAAGRMLTAAWQELGPADPLPTVDARPEPRQPDLAGVGGPGRTG